MTPPRPAAHRITSHTETGPRVTVTVSAGYHVKGLRSCKSDTCRLTFEPNIHSKCLLSDIHRKQVVLCRRSDRLLGF